MLLLVAALAHALQPNLSEGELEALATLVVTGEVTTVEPRWAEGAEGVIETVVYVAVEEVHRGAPVSDLELFLEGGALGEHRTVHSEEPVLVEDGRYRLRLVRDFEGRWRVIGGARGAPRLDVPAGPQAYVLNGYDWSWQGEPVEDGFLLNTGSFPPELPAAEVGAAWSLALDIWNIEGVATLYLPNDGVTADLTYGGGDDGHNVTMYEDFDWGSALAASVSNLVGDELIDCDTRFYGSNLNGSLDWSTAFEGADGYAYDFTHTAIHELGHCLGLGHSGVEAALMYPYNDPGTGWERRHLHSDDVAGLHAMYAPAAVALTLGLTLADEGDGDGVAEPGEDWSFEATTSNLTDAPSVLVVLAIDAGGALVAEPPTADLDDVPPHTDAAPFTGTLSVADGCDDGAATVTVTAEDAAGNVWTADAEVTLDCPGVGSTGTNTDPTLAGDEAASGESPAGCGCDSTPSSGGARFGFGAAAALMAWRRRPCGSPHVAVSPRRTRREQESTKA